MNILDNPKYKTQYQKSRLKVKRWESEFSEKNRRKPTKNDIKNADTKIKEAYKTYWDLKTKALDETLNDITFNDSIEANVSANTSISELSSEISLNSPANNSQVLESSEIFTNDTEKVELLTKNAENIAPESSPKKDLAPCKSPQKPDTVNVPGAWGTHLNKDNEQSKKRKSLLVGRYSSFQLSKIKFTAASFAKRNPRKSLPLTRNKTEPGPPKSTAQAPPSPEKPEDIDSVKIINHPPKITALPMNPIHQLMNAGSQATEKSFGSPWIDRRSQETTAESNVSTSKRLSGVSDSGIESIDACDKPAENSDDDFVCNSDTDEEYRNKRTRNWRKTLSEVPSQPRKRPRLSFFSENSISSTWSHLNSSENSQTSELSTQIHAFAHLTTKTDTTNVVKSNLTERNQLNEPEIVQHNSETVDEAVEDTVPPPKAQECSDDESEEPKTRRTRVLREKPASRTAKTRQPPTTKRVTRQTRKKAEISDEEAEKLDSIEGPSVPIYGVESLEVVSRFPVPRDAKGDLISAFSQSVQQGDLSAGASTSKPKVPLTAQEKLEAKMASGKANDNFVRINLKKKVFVRGKKRFNFSKYKKNQWKQKKNGLASSEDALDLADLAEKNTCFKCGGSGHFARKCPSAKSESLMPLEEYEDSEYPTMEEIEKMASKEAIRIHGNRIDRLPECPSIQSTSKADGELSESENHVDGVDFEDGDFDEAFEEPESSIAGHKIPQELVDKLLPPINGIVEPLYAPAADGSVPGAPPAVIDALRRFGHEKFRPGQEKAIMRILSGQSTLVTLSTGSGKSLCYQLPAYLFSKQSRCITLVVSPLVSLMDDQVTGVPGFISAAALHTGQTPKVREKIMETIRDGNLDILLVSPEAIVAGEKSTGFGSLLRQLPPIAFACIDEAHCISQWSDNFRPSYLMVCRVLIEKLGVKTILGLTATATKNTAESIVSHLKIHDGMDGVISDTPLPKNLTLTVSRDEQRDEALMELLRSPRFHECDSIIIYCTRREECTRIAGLLRISLQASSNKPKTKAKVSPIAEAYHAGLAAGRRKTIQKAFMNGTTRIVVATVAFGMGINKSDIRSVIHYNMPRSFEGYVQEVGRAGRDNLPAHCHLFLSPAENSDKWELRRFIYSDGVDRFTIRRLLQKVFLPCSCRENGRKCPGHEVAIPIDDTVKALDVSEESISTLLCYLELHPKKFITVLSSVYVTAKVSSYGGSRALKLAAQKSPPLAMAIALDKKRGVDHENSTIIEFPVVDIAAAIGWDSGVVKSHLKSLEWEIVDGKSRRSAISVRYDTLGLRVRAPGDLTATELDEALDALTERTRTQQSTGLQQLEIISAALTRHSHKRVAECLELTEKTVKMSEELKNIIREYFQSSSPMDIIEFSASAVDKSNEEQIIADIRSLLCSYRDNSFNGRAVARLFHGIQSPNYSALEWYRCRFWRAHLAADFNWISELATKEIISMQ